MISAKFSASRSDSRILLVTLNDKYIKSLVNDLSALDKLVKPLTQPASQMTVDIYEQFPILNYFKLKLQTPFNSQLLVNLKDIPLDT